MDFFQDNGAYLVAGVIFTLVYIYVTFEHLLAHTKAPATLIGAGLLWVWTSFFVHGDELAEAAHDMSADVMEIFIFLFAAMCLVDILVHMGLFDWIRYKLLKLGLADRQQALLIWTITFFLSAGLDNLTTTIVMTTISFLFFKGWNRLIAVIGIVIMANAGGAWSPIGDVTTVMLWVDGKFGASEVVRDTFLPSLVHAVVAMALLSLQIRGTTADSLEDTHQPVVFTNPERIIIGLSLGSFTLPFVFTQRGLPPALGLVAGLGVVWTALEFMKYRLKKRLLEDEESKSIMDTRITDLIRNVDVNSLLFFVGILSMVGALSSLGALDAAYNGLPGDKTDTSYLAGIFVVFGWLSAFVDNVPLTALAMDTVPTEDSSLWTLLAYTVGTGGSHLLIGSVAGVVASDIYRRQIEREGEEIPAEEHMTSSNWFRIATKVVAPAFLAGLIFHPVVVGLVF